EHFGNPSSTHEYGEKAHEAVEKARAQVAALLGAQPDEIVFMGGGTEATNHALKGAVLIKLRGIFGRWARGAQIITSAIEHPATLQTCEFLRRLGCTVNQVPVDSTGLVDVEAIRKHLSRSTTIVSIMHANNEVGTIEPIRQIADVARSYGA